MTTQRLQISFKHLRRRINYFLTSTRWQRYDVALIINRVESLGPTVIFGGMLRDILIHGNRSFFSDVDIVVANTSISALEGSLTEFNPRKNKFGGFRIRFPHWDVDVWTVESTWAFQKGLVAGASFSDLVKTTFFDWDGIAIETKTRKIYALPNYLSKINSNTLEINLRENSNPNGMLIRSLRLIRKYSCAVGVELFEFIKSEIAKTTVESILQAERGSNAKPLLDEASVNKIILALQESDSNTLSAPVILMPPKEPNLPFFQIPSSSNSQSEHTKPTHR